MGLYIVQHTPILHGAEKKKTADMFNPGEEIELTEKEAEKLGDNVKVKPSGKKKDDGKSE